MIGNRVWKVWRHRVRPFWRDARPIVVVVAGLAVIVLGTIGYLRVDDSFGFFDALYRAVALFGLTGNVAPPVPWELEIARILGPLIFAWSYAGGAAKVHGKYSQGIGFLALLIIPVGGYLHQSAFNETAQRGGAALQRAA